MVNKFSLPEIDENSRIPIIALTANAMNGEREKWLGAGMDEFVAKPIHPQKLIGAIERCLRPRMRDEAAHSDTSDQ
jgi:CheY-like chemotaxis protein